MSAEPGRAAEGWTTVHATCVVLGRAGVLLRGPSRAGKSTLARRLIAAGEAAGWFARLVGDDRIRLRSERGRLIARPHPSIAGLIEVRGVGILPIPYEPSCRLRLVVDLVEDPPDEPASEVHLHHAILPRIAASRDEAASRVMERVRDLDDTVVTVR